jgi:hypothetical protein
VIAWQVAVVWCCHSAVLPAHVAQAQMMALLQMNVLQVVTLQSSDLQ